MGLCDLSEDILYEAIRKFQEVGKSNNNHINSLERGRIQSLKARLKELRLQFFTFLLSKPQSIKICRCFLRF